MKGIGWHEPASGYVNGPHVALGTLVHGSPSSRSRADLMIIAFHSLAKADRFFAPWVGLAQLAIERGRMALQDHLRDFPDRGALVHKSATQRNLLRR